MAGQPFVQGEGDLGAILAEAVVLGQIGDDGAKVVDLIERGEDVVHDISRLARANLGRIHSFRVGRLRDHERVLVRSRRLGCDR